MPVDLWRSLTWKGKKMAKQQVYSFVEKKYSVNGIASAILGIGAVLVLAACLLFSYNVKGQVDNWIGAVGFTGILMSIGGLGYGFAGLKDECKSYFTSKLGLLLSIACILVWFFVVCFGLIGR